jgi:hypothetical protein
MAYLDSKLDLEGLRRSVFAAAGLTALLVLPACTDRAVDDGTIGDDGDGDGDGDDGATSGASDGDAGTDGDGDGDATTGPPAEAVCFPAEDQYGEVRICSDDLANCGDCLQECVAQAEAALAAVGKTSCGGWELEAVTCSEVLADQCCQVVRLYDVGCAGRPFEVHGEARVAPLAHRGDWAGELGPVGLGTLDATARAVLAEHWREVALAEHASIASFARFSIELMTMGAPPELLRSAQRAAADEVEHARLAFGLASAYGGVAVGPGRFDPGPAGPRSDAEIVTAAVLEGCIEETLSAALASAAAAAAVGTDATVASILGKIARDEQRHAALAWAFVRWVADRRPELRPVIDGAFARGLEDVRRRALAGPGADSAFDSAALVRYGRLDATSRAAVIERVCDAVVAVAHEGLQRVAA